MYEHAQKKNMNLQQIVRKLCYENSTKKQDNNEVNMKYKNKV